MRKPGDILALLLKANLATPDWVGSYREQFARLTERWEAETARALGESDVTLPFRLPDTLKQTEQLGTARDLALLIEQTLALGDDAAWDRLENARLAMLGLSTHQAKMQRVLQAVEGTIKHCVARPEQRNHFVGLLLGRLGAVDRKFRSLTGVVARKALTGAKPASKGGARGPNLVAAKLCVAVGAFGLVDEKKAKAAFVHQAEIMAATVESLRQ
jgi:hypothetical protein